MTLSQRLPIWLLSGLLAIGSVACSGTEKEQTDDAADASDATDAADASDATDASDPSTTSDCTATGFTAGTPSQAQSTDTYWRVVTPNSDGTTIFVVESYMGSQFNGPGTTGTYDIGATNYADCGLCLLMYADCTDGQGCQTTYYADVGTVNVTALTLGVDGTVEVNVTGAVFTEVTIDGQSFQSTPVANAKTWCVNDNDFSGTFVNPDAPDLTGATAPEAPEMACVGTGNGAGVGANLADFTLTNCNGEEVNMHSLACSEDVDAVWFVASADWCGPCHTYADTAKARLDNGNQAGISLVEVIGEDLDGNAATIETCKKYADQHSIDYSHMFFDAKWQTLFANIWAYPTASGTMYFPWVGVAKGANLEYVYSSQFNAADYPGDTYNGEGVLNELAGVPGPADTTDTTDTTDGTDGTDG